MTSVAVVGCTGLVGSHILTSLISQPTISNVHALARKDLSTASTKVHPVINKDTAEWLKVISTLSPPPSIFLSALGTTRAAAGGLENQRKIDYDLNLDLARAAKEAGVKCYVLISLASANASSMVPYTKMKGELEDRVQELGFEHLVIVRPGLIVGDRQESRPAEAVVRKIAGLAGFIGNGLKDFWAQDADVIAKAAIAGGTQAIEGKLEGKVMMLGQSDIIRLGRTEWKS